MSAEEGAVGEAPAIDVAGLGLRGTGPVFSGVDLRVPAGGFQVLRGPAGSGKTSLLLALAGRMKVTEGHGTVNGFDLRREAASVRRTVALAHVAGITDVDGDLTVQAHLAERLIMLQPWYKPAASRRRVHEIYRAGRRLIAETASSVAESIAPERRSAAPGFADAFGEKTFVSDLTELQTFALEVALAIMSEPAVLAIDNVDLMRESADRRRAWSGLLSLQRRYPTLTILAACEEDRDLHELPRSLGHPDRVPRFDLLGR